MSDVEMEALVVRAKAELRKRLRALRQGTPTSACARRSEQIAARVLGLDAVLQARTVALFYPIVDRHEVDLRAVDAALRARGVTVAYPHVDEATRAMTFRVTALDGLVDDPLGFRGAPSSAPEATDLDVIVVPALAFDGEGRRLGYGGGHYDRALVRTPRALTVGVIYDFQLLAEVPVLRTDIPVRVVVTDARVHEVAV